MEGNNLGRGTTEEILRMIWNPLCTVGKHYVSKWNNKKENEDKLVVVVVAEDGHAIALDYCILTTRGNSTFAARHCNRVHVAKQLQQVCK